MNIEEMLNVSVDVKVEKEATSEEKVLNWLKEYENNDNSIKELEDLINIKEQELTNKIRETYKELYDEIEELKLQKNNLTISQEAIKNSASMCFEEYYKETNNKKLSYGLCNATYVAPTTKHSFKLKEFLAEHKDFYDDNKDILEPYAKVSPVAGYVKITVEESK